MNLTIKTALKKLARLGIDVNYSLDRGLSVGGINLRKTQQALAPRGEAALKYCLDLRPASVLDVGSGGGEHAAAFSHNGAETTCVDFGTSIYAQKAVNAKGVITIKTDFLLWQPECQYSLIWASHVLEHQRNVGVFIEKLISCCATDGRVAITVPFPHRHLWGGHLTLWTPGLLAYNIVLAGVDLSDAAVFYGYRETSIVFSPRRISLPELTFDNGDLDRLARFLPKGFRENTDAWF